MREQRLYHQDFKARALQLHKDGMTRPEICKALGLNRNTLRGWIVAANTPVATPMTNIAKADRANMAIRLAEMSVTLPSVAGRRYSYVHGALVIEEVRP